MKKINMVRVILGGLLAGLVLNIVDFFLNGLILGEQWAAGMAARNLAPMSSGDMAWLVAMSFVLGIAIVWLYAAIRPRYGAGPKTAIYAGLAGWFFLWLLPYSNFIIVGLYPTKLLLISLAFGLFEATIVSLSGAWLYKEE